MSKFAVTKRKTCASCIFSINRSTKDKVRFRCTKDKVKKERGNELQYCAKHKSE